MYEKQAIEAKISAHPYWYHRIALPYGIVTPGWAPIDPEAYYIHDRLDGLRVLDVGAWDGYWSFEALRRGAREVVAIDDFSDQLGSDNIHRTAWDTFDLCREILGYDDDRCKRVEIPVYNVTEEDFGRFDVVFFFGTLYHLRHPLLALDRLSAICDHEIFIESAVLDDFSPYQGGLGKGYPGFQMLMEFYPGKQFSGNATNWWTPTLNCLVNLVAAAGFETCKAWKLVDNPDSLPLCRGFAHGRKI